jgi:hypothetical protein
MDHIGIDVHKNHSQMCLITAAGEVLHQRQRVSLRVLGAGRWRRLSGAAVARVSTSTGTVTQSAPTATQPRRATVSM